jgi:peroxiredoxin
MMNNKTWLIFAPVVLLTTFFSCAGRSFSEKEYVVKVAIRGATGGKAYLGFYYSDNLYVKDSAFFNDKGEVLFKGKGPLAHGVYFCYSDSSHLKFDFIVTHNKIDIVTSRQQPLEDLKDIDAEDNNRYREFRMGIDHYLKTIAALRRDLSVAKERSDSLKCLTTILGKDAELQNEQAKIIASCKGSVAGEILRLMRMEKRKPGKEPAMTDAVAADEAFHYYRDHYWDYVNLKDSLVLRVPVLQQKVQEYFSMILPQQPDSIIRAMDALLAKTDADGPLRRELLLMLGSKYATPDVTDQDAVFVYLTDHYLLTRQLPEWIDSTRFQYIKGIRDKMAPNRVGQKAPALNLTDMTGADFSLDQLNADRTLLLFYDPECDHCHKEVEALQRSYSELQKNGVAVITVCITSDEQKWRKYVGERKLESINLADLKRVSSFRNDYNVYATPLLFILDRQKVILEKTRSLEELAPFLPVKGNTLTKR